MISFLLLLTLPGWAQGLRLPVLPNPVVGECPESIPVRAQQALPLELVAPGGLALCSGVVFPISQAGYLLKLEQYQIANDRLHLLDIKLLETERDWYRDELDTQLKPKPWYERPAGQRWIGRAEMLLVTAIVTAGMGYAYSVNR